MRKSEGNYAVKLLELCRQTICVLLLVHRNDVFVNHGDFPSVLCNFALYM